MSFHATDWLGAFLRLAAVHQQAVAAGATPQQAKMATVVEAVSIAAEAPTPTGAQTPALAAAPAPGSAA